MADKATIAVASNFLPTMKALAAEFEHISGDGIIIAGGSSGKLYAQIINGAPFDAFFSADQAKPQALINQGIGEVDTRFTYAVGELVLWSRSPQPHSSFKALLASTEIKRVAVANGKLAPYGDAASQLLRKYGWPEKYAWRLVEGENIAQSLHFAMTGNVDLAFVALSQVKALESTARAGYVWRLPNTDYAPIRQDAILLNSSNSVAKDFLRFLSGREARIILSQFGYREQAED